MSEVVCCCFNVTKDDIKKHIKNGVKTFEELQELTQLGTECPPCGEESKKVFEELLQLKD